jgi:hypothetical protein
VALPVRLVIGGIAVFPASREQTRNRGQHCQEYDSPTHLAHFDTPAEARQPARPYVHIVI